MEEAASTSSKQRHALEEASHAAGEAFCQANAGALHAPAMVPTDHFRYTKCHACILHETRMTPSKPRTCRGAAARCERTKPIHAKAGKRAQPSTHVSAKPATTPPKVSHATQNMQLSRKVEPFIMDRIDHVPEEPHVANRPNPPHGTSSAAWHSRCTKRTHCLSLNGYLGGQGRSLF